MYYYNVQSSTIHLCTSGVDRIDASEVLHSKNADGPYFWTWHLWYNYLAKDVTDPSNLLNLDTSSTAYVAYVCLTLAESSGIYASKSTMAWNNCQIPELQQQLHHGTDPKKLVALSLGLWHDSPKQRSSWWPRNLLPELAKRSLKTEHLQHPIHSLYTDNM